MSYFIRITSRPCGMTDALLAILPTIERAYPHVKIDIIIKDAMPGPFPETAVMFRESDGQEHVTAILYGYRTEQQHMFFLSSVLDTQWVCAVNQ